MWIKKRDYLHIICVGRVSMCMIDEYELEENVYKDMVIFNARNEYTDVVDSSSRQQ